MQLSNGQVSFPSGIIDGEEVGERMRRGFFSSHIFSTKKRGIQGETRYKTGEKYGFYKMEILASWK